MPHDQFWTLYALEFFKGHKSCIVLWDKTLIHLDSTEMLDSIQETVLKYCVNIPINSRKLVYKELMGWNILRVYIKRLKNSLIE